MSVLASQSVPASTGEAPLAYHGRGPARVASVKRKTRETEVELSINLDGTGKCAVDTPVGFLNHMLDQISSHGLIDLTVKATGDTWIDDHHTVEDIALALGSALSQVCCMHLHGPHKAAACRKTARLLSPQKWSRKVTPLCLLLCASHPLMRHQQTHAPLLNTPHHFAPSTPLHSSAPPLLDSHPSIPPQPRTQPHLSVSQPQPSTST